MHLVDSRPKRVNLAGPVIPRLYGGPRALLDALALCRGIQVLSSGSESEQDVDGRDKPGHDGFESTRCRYQP